jgi:glutamate formiminotransferase
MPIFECVPNVSEGRRPDVLAACVDAARAAGASVLDASRDAVHHRSVITLAATAGPLLDGVLALMGVAIDAIDLRSHTGAHPRMGAVDVVPFVPLGTATLAEAVDLAREAGAAIARRFSLPVYLYEAAASSPARRALQDVRRGGFEALAARMREPGGAPDFGPSTPHPTAGATAIGARGMLVAYNVNLATTRLDVARRIAAAVRERSGGLPFVKAMAVDLPDRGLVQVSMNLTNVDVTPLVTAFDAVAAEAARDGIDLAESEIIGLVPRRALPPDPATRLQIPDFTEARILERQLEAAGLDDQVRS